MSHQLYFQNLEHEDLYQLLCDQAADGIFMLDLKGNIVYANKAACQMIKLSQRQVVGKHFVRFVPRDSLHKAREYLRKVKSGIPVIRDQLEVVDKNGGVIPVEFTATAIHKNGKIFQFHAIIRDITQRKELENLLVESEKTKALEHFIVGAAREIQLPLKAVLTLAENLIYLFEGRTFEYVSYKEFKQMMQTLQSIHGQVKSCFKTTTQLLDIYKRKLSFTRGYSQVNFVVEEVIKTLAYLFKKFNIRLNLNLAGHMPPAAVGAVELNQVISQILMNAIQAIPGRGAIYMKTFYHKEKKCVLIECRDEGIGISKENLPHIFDPFFTTKQKVLDSHGGLGLSIVYSIVKACRGDIRVTSNLRKGTTVKIVFPVYLPS